ncbi:APC family permease [Myxococcaceae bacterium JPH2]|nr:APC family permease [Myxococcaceae bacterium JPH2]
MKARTEFLFYVSVGVGMALATSSFTVVSGLFQILSSPWVLQLAVLLAGVFCAVIALSIAELASMFPSAPGVRTYLKAAFGPRSSLVLVYLYLIFTVLMAGVEGYMFALVFKAAFPSVPPTLTALVLMGGVIVINGVGLELPRDLQMATTYASVLLLLGASAYGLIAAPAPLRDVVTLSEGVGQLSQLPAAVGMAIFLYMGFEWAAPVGLKPKAYERKIPISLPVCVAVLSAIYILFVLALPLYVARGTVAASSVPHVLYFEAMFGRAGTYVALVLSFGAVVSTFNAGIMGGSRLVFMLAREGLLPAWCGTTSAKTGAPIGGVLALGGVACVSALVVSRYELQLVLALISATIMCVIYAAFLAAALSLRKSRPQARRSYRTPIFPWLQGAVALVLPCLGLGTLLSVPEQGLLPVYWMLGCLVTALVTTEWSLRFVAMKEQRGSSALAP